MGWKLFRAPRNVEKFDELAIIVSFEGKEQLSRVPEILTSSEEGKIMSDYKVVENLGITDKNSGTFLRYDNKQHWLSKWCQYKFREIVQS